MKIGFFGGSFDPPHRGHLALARLAIERAGLGRVLMAPVGSQPLKRDAAQASFEDRCAMLRLAMRGAPGLELSLLDAPRPDGQPNYTIDTIDRLRNETGGTDSVWLVAGADAFLTIGQWREAARLLASCGCVLGARPGFDLGDAASALPPGVRLEACAEAERRPGTRHFLLRHGEGGSQPLILLEDLSVDVSATEVREALSRGAADCVLAEVLDPPVLAYIRERGLYARSGTADRDPRGYRARQG